MIQIQNVKPSIIKKTGKPNLFKSLEIGIWDLFVFWCLEFGIYKLDIQRSFLSSMVMAMCPRFP